MSAPIPPQFGNQPPYPYQPRPPKRRPSAWWFAPGAAALVVAALGAVFFVTSIIALDRSDGYVDGDGQPHSVVLTGAGEHMLFGIYGDSVPACTVTDDTGTVTVLPLGNSGTTLTVDGDSWVPFGSFTSSSATIGVSCTTSGSQVRVGAPAGRSQMIKIGASVIGAGVFGLAGLAAVITVAVLYLSRRPRSVTG